MILLDVFVYLGVTLVLVLAVDGLFVHASVSTIIFVGLVVHLFLHGKCEERLHLCIHVLDELLGNAVVDQHEKPDVLDRLIFVVYYRKGDLIFRSVRLGWDRGEPRPTAPNVNPPDLTQHRHGSLATTYLDLSSSKSN